MPDRDLRRALGHIVEDLWGTPQAAAAPPAAAAKETPACAPTLPPFEQWWQTADETVDWTQALYHEKPADHLTAPQLWQFFHQEAEKVLQGDTAAYAHVLQTAKPLADLTPYVEGYTVQVESADKLAVHVTPLPTLTDRRSVAAIALRAARDLMALLPVCQVAVEATCREKVCLNVCYERTELQKVRFAFINPVDFTLACGGSFAEET